jgi:hypothetical protein
VVVAPVPPVGVLPPSPPLSRNKYGKAEIKEYLELPPQESSFGTWTRPANNREAAPPVILFSDTHFAVDQMAEDLAVMSRLLENALERAMGDDDYRRKMGVLLTVTGNNRPVSATFIERAGPIFTVRVDFPLLGAAKAEAKPAAPAPSSEWEKAQRAVRGLPEEGGGGAVAAERFDSGKVAVLKRVLSGALRHAGNIRQLGADDFITVCVIGTGDPAVTTLRLVRAPGENPTFSALGEMVVNDGTWGWGRAGTGSTMLTMRVKKSDADEAVRGGLSEEEFAKRLTVYSYAGPTASETPRQTSPKAPRTTAFPAPPVPTPPPVSTTPKALVLPERR